MDYAIAVLDIGKTNKKLVIYDNNIKQIDSIYSSFPTIKNEDLDVEDIEGINTWFIEGLKTMGSKYPIKVILKLSKKLTLWHVFSIKKSILATATKIASK